MFFAHTLITIGVLGFIWPQSTFSTINIFPDPVIFRTWDCCRLTQECSRAGSRVKVVGGY